MSAFARFAAAVGFLAAVGVPGFIQAQDVVTIEPVAAPAAPAFAEITATAPAPGPTTDAATAGIRVHTTSENLTAHDAAARAMSSGGGNVGTGVALMIVGGAALITGLIIGGGAGTALAVGGVLVGAFGLYVFLK
jgi:hypothetical protein